MKKSEIEERIESVLKNGNWMICTDHNGAMLSKFKYNMIGVWMESPEWNSDPESGCGIYGQDMDHGGTAIAGMRTFFCETEGEHVIVNSNMIKVKRARVLMMNELPEGLTINYHLDLRYSTIEYLPDGLKVYGNLFLGRTKFESLPSDLEVGGDLDLYNSKVKEIPESIRVGGNLYIDSNTTTLPSGLKVGKRIFMQFPKDMDEDEIGGEE